MPFSVLCIVGYKTTLQLWTVTLAPQTAKASTIQHPTIFWLYQKNKQPANDFTS
jgi:hypothetical protein